MIEIKLKLAKQFENKLNSFFLLFVIISVLVIAIFIIDIQVYFTDIAYDSMNHQVLNIGEEIELKINSIEGDIVYTITSGVLNNTADNDKGIKRFLSKYRNIVKTISIYDTKKSVKYKFSDLNNFTKVEFDSDVQSLNKKMEIVEENGIKYIIIPYFDNNTIILKNYKIEIDIENLIINSMKDFYVNGEYWTWFVNNHKELTPIEYSEEKILHDKFSLSKVDHIKKDLENGIKGFISNSVIYDGLKKVSSSYYPLYFYGYKYGIGVSIYNVSIIREITLKISFLVFIFTIMIFLIIFYFSILVDKEKKSTMRRINSEESIDRIINYVPFGVVLYDSDEVVKVNDYAKNQVGIMEGIISEKMIEKFSEIESSKGNVIKVRLKNGQEVSIVGRLTTISYETRKVNFLSFIDITIIDEARELAEESNEIKSRFIDTVSHEIRTPMNGIIASIELLESIDIDNEEADNYIKIVKSSSENLLSMVNDILEMSKIEKGKLTINYSDFNLREVLKSVYLQFFAMVDNDKVNYSISIDENLPIFVRNDENKLRQILINIIGNAVKFTIKGEILVKVNQIERVNNIVNIEFIVADTGIGIEKNELGKIFNEFYQIEDSNKRNYQGSGLGTTIAKELVLFLGGNINAESPNKILDDFNCGSKISFNLYMEFVETENSSNEKESINNELDKNFKILLVEDNKINAKITKKILNNANFEVDVAFDGQDVIDKYNESYDLILMDIQMPIKDGFEATKEIRALNKEIIIIALTANNKEVIRKKTEEANMNGIIVKPFSKNKISEILNIVNN